MLCAQTFAIQKLIINYNFYYNLDLNQTEYLTYQL